MPLREGKSREVVSDNIRTEMHHYDATGEVGLGSHPKSRKKAQKQAVAIALSKSREKKANLLDKVAELIVKGASAVTEIRDDLKKHEKEDVVQEKKTNRYLKKLVKMEEAEKKANQIIKDTARAYKDAPKADDKFFTRQKLRGC